MSRWLLTIYRRFAPPRRESSHLEIVEWSRASDDDAWSSRILYDPEPQPRAAPLGGFALDDGDSDRISP